MVYDGQVVDSSRGWLVIFDWNEDTVIAVGGGFIYKMGITIHPVMMWVGQ